MRIHRFYIKGEINDLIDGGTGKQGSKNISTSGTAPTSVSGDAPRITLRAFHHDDLLNQWGNVFRYIAGSRVILFDDSGREYMMLIQSLNKSEAQLSIIEEIKKKQTEYPTLYLSILKNENFYLAIQKATELGISKIVPIISDRTIKKDINLERAKKILTEATEQSGQTIVPEISSPISLENLMKEVLAMKADSDESKNFQNVYEQVCVCYQEGESIQKVFLANQTKGNSKKNPKNSSSKNSPTGGTLDLGSTALFVGPEGGWSKNEMNKFEAMTETESSKFEESSADRKSAKNNKWSLLKINKNILRAETAVIAALAILNSFGNLED